MPDNFSRLQRSDWGSKGANNLARELYNILNAPASTSTAPTDGFYLKFNESGTGDSFAVNLQAGGGAFDYGTIVEGGGTSYIIRLNGGNKVTALAPRILVADEITIPGNSKAVVFRMPDNSYRLVAAVWTVAVD